MAVGQLQFTIKILLHNCVKKVLLIACTTFKSKSPVTRDTPPTVWVDYALVTICGCCTIPCFNAMNLNRKQCNNNNYNRVHGLQESHELSTQIKQNLSITPIINTKHSQSIPWEDPGIQFGRALGVPFPFQPCSILSTWIDACCLNYQKRKTTGHSLI